MTRAGAAIGLAAAAAAAVAILTIHDYFTAPAALWSDASHDRNGHLAAGQQFGIAFRSLDGPALVDGIERAKVWPPLHDLVLGLVFAFGGIDHRLAILPATIAWFTTIVMVAVIGSKSLDDSRQGVAVALIAAALALTSPALRLLGADVMLEIPGAMLSALSLFLFSRAAAEPTDRARWRHLAIALTLLFLTKYNYWLLCVLALAVTWLSLTLDSRGAAERTLAAAKTGGRFALQALRSPVGILGAAVFFLAALIQLRGPTTVEAFGHEVGLYPPHNIITVGYGLLLVALTVTLRARRSQPLEGLDPAVRIVSFWHVLPVALWLLLPDRINSFLWFVGPVHFGTGPLSGYSAVFEGAAMYWAVFVTGFHAAPAVAWAVPALFALALVRWPSLNATGRAVVLFAILCALLVIAHPDRQPRFLAHWLFAVWIGAGMGAAQLLWWLLPQRYASARLPAAAALAASLCLFSLGREPSDAASRSAHRPISTASSDLELTSLYLTRIDPSRPHAVLASFGRTPLPVWAARQACRCLVEVEQPWLASNASDDQPAVLSFLDSTTVDVVVSISYPDYPYAVVRERGDAIAAALAAQQTFVLAETLAPMGSDARVSIWRRRRGP